MWLLVSPRLISENCGRDDEIESDADQGIPPRDDGRSARREMNAHIPTHVSNPTYCEPKGVTPEAQPTKAEEGQQASDLKGRPAWPGSAHQGKADINKRRNYQPGGINPGLATAALPMRVNYERTSQEHSNNDFNDHCNSSSVAIRLNAVDGPTHWTPQADEGDVNGWASSSCGYWMTVII